MRGPGGKLLQSQGPIPLQIDREDHHWACGDFGVSEWTLTGTSASGKSLAVRGVDLLEFVDGKIARKDSFWKIVE